MPVETNRKIRFGPFELDTSSGELFKLGHKLSLHGQPIEVLSILLERPGEVITREELCKRLWPQDTFVDFEHSLNTAIKKLRQSLDDDPDAPRYIETLPKKGYRFIAQAEKITNGLDPLAVEPAFSPLVPAAAGNGNEPVVSRTSHRWMLAASIALVVAIGAGTLYRIYRPRTPVFTAIHQLTRTGQAKWAVATDGTRVYYIESFGGQPHLTQVPARGGDVSHIETPLIRSPGIRDISDDASMLLLADASSKLEDPHWFFTLPNGPARKFPGPDLGWPVFLPGSKQLAYILAPDRNRLFTINQDGSEAHAVMSAPGPISRFSVAPDAQRIRFTIDGRLWESRLDGSALHRFLPERSEPIPLGRWSPDGKSYIFLSQGSDGLNLWAVTESKLGSRRLTSRPVQLTFGPVAFFDWAATRDGDKIFALGSIQRGELVAFDSQLGEFRAYLNGISAALLDFSRDGQWVTYVAYPEWTLWRSRLDGSQRQQLTTQSMGMILFPKFSPDGRFIAFMDWGQRNIHLIPAEGGSPMLLLAGDFLPADPTWSPDGKSIAYGGAVITGTTEVRILDLATRQSATVPGSQHLFSPRWSPDGRYLTAISDDSTKLFLYNFEKPGWTQLALPPLPKPAYIGCQTWAHDGQYLYVLGSSRVYKFRVPDGHVELAASLTDFETASPFGWGWFGLTPDDRVMVLRDRSTTEVYALDLEYR